ncbi:Signal peptidase I [Pandoravirus quercus]|uniref:Signal peptidase I n=2 Tax=Pandoravirus TaxID=2060084 RepID=A0A2U7UA01_9VIRU|nr:Signal peptidase I [Pandoravirus quercus]AVK75264.1 Signal peptidase I [Pandoravirus quercus]QBZ81437.1 Peptidase domain containing protein [Pandoravirus celtis]
MPMKKSDPRKMHTQKHTELSPAAEATHRPAESTQRTLSTLATVFWAVYPILWTCGVCLAVSCFLGCTMPLASVTSGSMEPQTRRGDMLLVVGPDFDGEVRVGDIVLYRLPHRPDTPIVHRVVEIVDEKTDVKGNRRVARGVGGTTTRLWYRTKGDNNDVDDAGLVSPSFPSGLVPHDALVGKVRGQIPLLGYPGLMPVSAKIAVALGCVTWLLHGLWAGVATPKHDDNNDDDERDRVSAWRWALLVLCPLL